MRISIRVALASAVAALGIACSTETAPQPSAANPVPAVTPASISLTLQSNAAKSAKTIERDVSMMDACDGPSFNAVVGAGDCSRAHGVSFSDFIALLTANQSVGSWHFGPPTTEAFLGDSILATNKGGEVHTFTRVAAFGGGVVPILNDLSGTPTEVPECKAENNFVPPGGTDTDALDKVGELKFQCCIHPWMRTTVLVKSH
jgi:hypothetical protein